MKIFTTRSREETVALAKKLGQRLSGGEVIAYRGGLGAGKTAFTGGLAEGYGISCDVTSPTFAIVNEYTDGEKTLYHFDMYRIGDADELYSTGFFDYLDGSSVLAVEWSENVDYALPEDTIYVDIKTIDESTREITISGENFDDNSWD